MLEILGDVFLVVILLLFFSTFMPPSVRQAVADSTTHLWRFLGESMRWLEPRAYRLVTGRDPRARTGQLFPPREAPHPAVEREKPLPAAENADLHGGAPATTAEEFAPATADELRALARALRHNLTTPDTTKSGAIKAGWGLARSGTDPRYKRASQLYDLATTPEPPPARFPELTPAKQRALLKARR